jgi:hypothetical protein
MSQDQDDSRGAPTTPAPAPISEREPKTNPEASEPATGHLVIPKAPPLPRDQLKRDAKEGDSYFADAARDFAASLVEMRETRQAIERGFREQEDKQAERHDEIRANQQLIASAIRAHGDRLIALERGQERTESSIDDLKEEIRLARKAADEAVRLANRALETVEELESKLPAASKD